MKLQDIRIGRVYWFRYGTSGVYRGQCRAIGASDVVLSLIGYQMPFADGSPFAVSPNRVVGEDRVSEPEPEPKERVASPAGGRMIDFDPDPGVAGASRPWWRLWG